MTRYRDRPPARPGSRTNAPTAAAIDRGHGIARVLSKLGYCSRTQGEALVREGRVRVDGRVVRDPEHRTLASAVRIEVDGRPVAAETPVTLMLNKPRGLVTTRDDPQGRETIYRCLEGLDLPHVSPVGRLDKASEGLLLLTNDTAFAQRLLDPASHVLKTYHVQIDRPADDALLSGIRAGVEDRGEHLAVRSVRLLREGERTAWLEIVLDEGRNRHIRRLLAALGTDTLRLVRVSIGALALGDLPKGAVRALTPDERARLERAP
ncbi:pseudouridine synthase [Aureimonas phyllosphaerae]|uniref:Pseudouridine synthase n=1 Tax=Aureimonas phyllosphaerae TaxID=1166078 RepID=A0A7W6BTJ2_9HYPH|nr:pseudouridine synthase [Aureimonas phyllosphaerae]MBB3936637.1 23S rRNA pseudouridine2605 synthase [Aureimonas phyllosphaerae]MBB3960499.1 23S rRNA pseudouridine2605 synthase [Aureimonas phyllosphaerae]SFF23846.1 23S rRNA pseudouridine2605 synthase [Aureimonas phyllosphaerae]